MEHKQKKEQKFSFSWKKWKTKKLIQKLRNEGVEILLFYTDISNIMYNIEYGIKPVDNLNLQKRKEYIVWTFSQLHSQINLELNTSGRTNFWSWISRQNIDISNVAVIAIDINKLFLYTKNNWQYDSDNKIVSIFENIDARCFEWVMIKNKHYQEIISNYANKMLPSMKVFYGDERLSGRY